MCEFFCCNFSFLGFYLRSDYLTHNQVSPWSNFQASPAFETIPVSAFWHRVQAKQSPTVNVNKIQQAM